MAGRRASNPVAFITVAAASILALVIYWPGLDSPFMGDDYRYLLVSRDMPWGDFLHDAFLPWVEPEASEVASDHWRPLSWTYFRLQYQVFGDAPVGYHLTSLAAHFAGIVVVWFLARRLRIATPGAVAATVIFAVHPAGFESVTWIAALSLVGFPLALAGWLAFLAALEASSRARRVRLHALALALIAIALLNRETAAAVFPAMGFWFLLVQRRDRLRDPRACLPLVPYAGLFLVYTLVSTWFFTVRSDEQLSFDRAALDRAWFYVQHALMPTSNAAEPVIRAQQVLGLVVLAVPFAALSARRWSLLALWLGFLGSLIPYALFSVGYGPRYFYFPGAFLALALGAATVELWPMASRLAGPGRLQMVATSGLVAGALALTVVGARRVDRWVEANPESQQRWIDELLREYPEFPEGGTLYVTNLPFPMAMFFGYVVQPTIQYLYPGEERKVQPFFRENLEDVRPWVGPRDGLFIPGE
ncbi:MAG: hypothetical protein AMXMBFR80_21840 [Dehalococcoidia bacterium]